MGFDIPFGPGFNAVFVLLAVLRELLIVITALVLLVWLLRHWR